jgi:hypothetical protein
LEEIKDCLNCSKSGVTDDDELYCTVKQEVVEENGYCEEHN